MRPTRPMIALLTALLWLAGEIPGKAAPPVGGAATSASKVGSAPTLVAPSSTLKKPTPKPIVPLNYQVFAWNDLGMHCYDSDFSIFCLLPPFNTLQAQVIQKGAKPKLATPLEVSVAFSAIADPAQSLNSTSFGKSNFWTHSQALFGAHPADDTGLTGTRMPGLANRPQTMAFGDVRVWTALGIPITNLDDQLRFNAYPMMRVGATRVKESTPATTVDAVVPVSSEMDCKSCHASGKVAANEFHEQVLLMTLSGNSDVDLQSRENILRLHDIRYNTRLWENRPVLCASCHYSKALDLAGAGPNATQREHAFLSRVMHGRHGRALDNRLPTADNGPIIADTGVQACYKCHPGNETNCLRSVMAGAGVGCQKCHGGMLAVAGQYPLTGGRVREPWTDLPKCQSCHTGDFVKNAGGALPRLEAFASQDPSATPVAATSSRFAENTGKLYRHSFGHGAVACAACHGSPHAEWPATNPLANDNITPNQLQGHAGVVIECQTCHDSTLPLTMNGPHGLHNVNSPAWVKDHKSFVESKGIASCQACHGLTLDGTHLSVAQASRRFTIQDRKSIAFAAGARIGCAHCHKKPTLKR